MDSSADKEGLQSSGRKEQSSRHAEEPTPAASAVPGAFGREDIDQETEGKPVVPSQHDVDEIDETELGLDDDDDDVDLDEEVTGDEAERADGA
jgi:hypothetical protein